MKLITTILLLISITMMTFSKAFIVLSFYANRSEIATKYCINKHNITMHCNGNCFLMRALKKDTQKHKDLQENFSKSTLLICHHQFPVVKDSQYFPITSQNHVRLSNTPMWKLYVFNRQLKPPTGYMA